MKQVAIIGSGIIGLTTAQSLVNQGFAVTIFSDDNAHLNCSTKAGAYWWPHKCSPEKHVLRWAKTSLDRYLTLQDNNLGIQLIDHVRLCEVADEEKYVLDIVDTHENLPSVFGTTLYHECYSLKVPFINIHRLFDYLSTELLQNGVVFKQRSIAHFDQLSGAFNLVINCSGLGAQTLCDDSALYPARGVTLTVTNTIDLNTSYRTITGKEFFTLILPRENDILLGGSVEAGVDSDQIDKQLIEQILQNSIGILPELADCEILGSSCGFRPNRHSIRLELDESFAVPVIHNYGHGGGGYTVAFGCADDCAEIASDLLSL